LLSSRLSFLDLPESLLVTVVAIAEATVLKQWEKTKAQEPKPEHKTKDNQKLFS
jgi:hypothetical protein